jgi:16S rRNA (guanine527-N7)-methyltransferase
LLEKENLKFNLTGARGWERVRDELFIRSMRLLNPAPGGYLPASDWLPGRKVVDVGAGAGVPGLVLKLLVPEVRVTLLDSSVKKTAFLRKVEKDLQLEGIEVITARAEDAGRMTEHREEYDLVVSRGVARLPELAELTLPFAAVGGTVISAKGPGIAGEVRDAEYAAAVLGAAPAITETVSSPGAMPPDTLVYWLKISSTPDQYPRMSGVPHTSPLIEAAARQTAHH